MLIVCLGDSVTQGLGVSKYGRSYGNLLQSKLQSLYAQSVQLMNLAGSAMQVHESRMKYEKKLMEMQPEIIIFAHGITESVVREQKKHLRFLPKRWRKPGWMDPRPYFSRRKPKVWLEKLESSLRWRVKVILIKTLGGRPWMSVDEFKQHTTDFILNVLGHNQKTKIILLTPGDIEERYFPGSPASMQKYRDALRDIYENSKSTNRVFMCDSSTKLHRWDDYFEDRFHPNEGGHNKIAEALMDTIVKYSLIDDERMHVMREVSG
ncbi:SGNH/GDSL hydrolase family protein [Paenibacillus sp. FSL K6-1566]|uniref:SGNH/GDSL hydrolase family protein n=1 Tax=Paenibacillus sp. FSL K6-1566 TaxID=2954515 RepID=UPI001B17193A|nr:SGNH/GDSL hydrolase family protein [Paenibacillus lactis]MCM3494429.1 SGNH/GDSL hydrolase family protein [Paenibacillus lactis]GIO89216.1 hypothetical protein J31TS3_04430 [Paenibacillus lactis]